MKNILTERRGGVVTEICGDQVEIAFYIDGDPVKYVYNFSQFSEVPKEGDRVEAMFIMMNMGSALTPEERAGADAHKKIAEAFNAINLAAKGPIRI